MENNNSITKQILNDHGLHIETIIDNHVYIVRGYKEGECYPKAWIMTMTCIITDGVVEAKAMMSLGKIRPSQFKTLVLYAKSLGCYKYIYERSDGETLTTSSFLI